MHKIVVVGTGTDVGKTIASAVITEALNADYWKPIQCGNLEKTDTDIVKLLISNDKSIFHPEFIKLKAPQSPHYAAKLENKTIILSKIKIPNAKNNLIIECAGGICVPLNSDSFFLDSIDKSTPILVVSKHELGSINHTLLSIKYLKTCKFKKISILYIGEEKPSTENIIITHENIFQLGRIPFTKELNKGFIIQQSKLVLPKLKEFLEV